MSLCPKYIVDRRILSRRDRPAAPLTAVQSRSASSPQPLPEAAVQLLATADTFWLGTTETSWGCQSSHRGGLPGFIRVSTRPSSALPRVEWADYRGNSMFHSLGTALHNPLAGLLVLDYQSGDCLQLAGKLATVFAPEAGSDLDGASRHVTLDVLQWRWTRAVVPFVFRTVTYSYHSPQLREARSAAASPSAAEAGGQLAELELVEVVQETADVSTFRLKACSGSAPLPQWLPAQYATLRLDVDGVEAERSWTITSLSSAASPAYTLDVTVKRADGGLVSSFLHQRARPGLRVRLVGVEGGFSTPSMYWTESAEGVTAVHGPPLRKLWLSAGIGITPFIAHMRCFLRFHALHHRAGVTVPRTDIVWLHTERTLERVPRLAEIAALVRASRTMTGGSLTVHLVLCLTQRTEQDLQPGSEEAVRANSLFGEDLQEDSMGHMPLAQLSSGRPNMKTLLHRCRCPATAPHVPVRCDDDLSCPRAVTLDDRSVDACGSLATVELFRSWCTEWKALGINLRNFRTESFAY